MFYLPLFHNLQDRACLVVGAGSTALRKINWLLRAAADVTVVSPEIRAGVGRLEQEGKLKVLPESFKEEHIQKDTYLVVSATNNPEVNARVSAAAQARSILVNCVDQPELCTFIFPSIVDRHPLIVAVSSMGYAPTLSRIVRGWIEQWLPPQLGRLGQWAQPLRATVKNRIPTIGARMRFWEQVFRGPVGELVLQGRGAEARNLVEDLLNYPKKQQGHIALIGAGPGDPELITLKALRLVQAADVILYDKLANPALLEYARRDAQKIFVGKEGPKPGSPPTRPDNRSNQQHDINQQLIAYAKAGKNVVRLKGGDPFIYGRGGEEMEQAFAADLDVTVVPGITAALGAASYAGIPLTYRNLSQSVRFVTGHRMENIVNLDWPELGRPGQTLVIYMGLVGLSALLETLRKHGCEADRPAALVAHATLPEQQVITGTVENLAARVAASEVDGPSVVIIGEVVALRRADA